MAPSDRIVEIQKKRVTDGHRLLGVFGLLVAMAAIFFGAAQEDRTSIVSVGLLSVGTSLLATIVFSVFDNLLSRRRFEELIEEQSAKVLDELHALELQRDAVVNARKVGLVQVFPWDQDESCGAIVRHFVREAQDLRIVMNYAHTWIAEYRDDLKARFKDADKQTTFVMPSPSEMGARAQAFKQGASLDTFSNDQAETFAVLQSLCPEGLKRPRFELAGHPLFNTYFLLLSEEEALYSPLFSSSGKKKLSCFWFKKTEHGFDYYSKLRDDVAALVDRPIDLRSVFREAKAGSSPTAASTATLGGNGGPGPQK